MSSSTSPVFPCSEPASVGRGWSAMLSISDNSELSSSSLRPCGLAFVPTARLFLEPDATFAGPAGGWWTGLALAVVDLSSRRGRSSLLVSPAGFLFLLPPPAGALVGTD